MKSQKGNKSINSSKENENKTEGIEEMTSPENVKSPKKTRSHTRFFYMAVNPKGGAVVTKKQLPIFWNKSAAREVANKMNGKAVKVTMSW